MSADTVLPQERLVSQIYPRIGWAADTDEVAAVLESTGINDSVAYREFGHRTVFALASQVLLAAGRQSDTAVEPPVPPVPLIGALVRAGLYVTPTIVAIGMAPFLGTLPWYAATGLLIVGWGAAQGMAHLGYQAANESGVRAAARLLGHGFVALATIWGILMLLHGATLVSYMVSAAQLMLFAANTVTLVTGTERRVLAIAMGSWAAVLASMAGAGAAAVILLFISLACMVVVGFGPALAPGHRWRPSLRQCGVAAAHGLVGGGQAVLFVLVVLPGAGMALPVAASAPLLLAIPLTELMLLKHQRRVAIGRGRSADRAAFQRHLSRISWLTALPLALPGSVALALIWWGSVANDWVLAASILLAGINAMCLVLVAHRRLSGALLLVWVCAALIALGTSAGTILLPDIGAWPARAGAAVMVCVYVPAIAQAVSAIKDPWSYR